MGRGGLSGPPLDPPLVIILKLPYNNFYTSSSIYKLDINDKDDIIK